MRRRVRRATRIVLSVFAGLFLFLTCVLLFCLIADKLTDRYARVIPSYERVDLGDVLAKEVWSDEDYDLLYHQTGLSRAALDSVDRERIPAFQDALFYSGEVLHIMAAFTTAHDYLKDFSAPIAPLETGDVLVTSSCHTFGWRNGHAAIVVDADRGLVLESVSLGIPSSISDSIGWFQQSSNFMVLRLKDASAERRAEIADWAKEHLFDVPYSITVGITAPKDQGDEPQITHCSHLVWQAFKHFGYDIDADGGPVCTSRDIALSPCFEVIQVSGFDPDRLW